MKYQILPVKYKNVDKRAELHPGIISEMFPMSWVNFCEWVKADQNSPKTAETISAQLKE
jgi:hypothetical protein